MAGVYKFGVPSDTPYEEAIKNCLEQLAATGRMEKDDDPVIETGFFTTPEHEANNEYIVKIVTGSRAR